MCSYIANYFQNGLSCKLQFEHVHRDLRLQLSKSVTPISNLKNVFSVFFIIIFRKALFPERLPNLKPKITKRSNRHKSSLVNSWCLPFPGSDRSVMMRTQRARYHTDNKRPVQISSYVQISSLFWVAMWTILGYFFGILANYKLGRTLLEACPGFFSSGTVSKQVYKNKFYKA